MKKYNGDTIGISSDGALLTVHQFGFFSILIYEVYTSIQDHSQLSLEALRAKRAGWV